MKTLLRSAFAIVSAALIAYPLSLGQKMVDTNSMLLCYNAGENGYLWPIIEYKCTLVPRGKGW